MRYAITADASPISKICGIGSVITDLNASSILRLFSTVTVNMINTELNEILSIHLALLDFFQVVDSGEVESLTIYNDNESVVKILKKEFIPKNAKVIRIKEAVWSLLSEYSLEDKTVFLRYGPDHSDGKVAHNLAQYHKHFIYDLLQLPEKEDECLPGF